MSPPDQEQRALGYGTDAVERPQVVIEDDSILTPLGVPKPAKKRKPQKGRGKLITIVASGFPGYNNNDPKEVERADAKFWFPNTIDFNRTASDTTGALRFGASNAAEFFGALQAAKGLISRVIFMGHGNENGLGLSGDTLSFQDERLIKDDFGRFQQLINDEIKPKLATDAVIDILACNTAAGEGFIQAMASSLNVKVRGFAEPVMWCLDWKGVVKSDGTLDYSQANVTSRGRIVAGSKLRQWEKANPGMRPRCSNRKLWHKGANKFIPPVPVSP
jgi:hypothetical protein